MRGILVALGISSLFFMFSYAFFEPRHAVLLAIVAFLVTLWTNEAMPLGAVSMLPILRFPLCSIADLNEVTPNYSKSIIFLFLGGFLLAIAIEKTALHRYFSFKLLSFFPKSITGIIYALSTTSALLSSILSNTTITLMLVPVAISLSSNKRIMSRFLLATAYGASVGGILTPIGTPPNLILLGFLEEHSLKMLTFGEWVVYMLPLVAFMLLVMPYILSMGLKGVGFGDEMLNAKRPEPLNKEQKRLFGIVVSLAFVLVANTLFKQIAHHSLNEKLILLGYGLLMFVPKVGFLDWEDTKRVPYEIIFLFGAGFSIAYAFTHTGLASNIAQKFVFISDMPFLLVLLAVSFFVTFATEITSNTALTSIAIPIFYEFSSKMPHAQGTTLLLVATVAASFAFMLPIATPPNAIVMSSKMIKIKQMASVGFWLNLIGIIALSLFAYIFWFGFLL